MSKNKTKRTKPNKLPPVSKDEIELNEKGRCQNTPRGWILTKAPKATLERHGIEYVEVYQQGMIPRLLRAYHPDDKIRIYRRERSGTIIPKLEEIPVNYYGNCDGIPYRWVETSLTKPQLKKINIPYVNAVVEWTKYGPRTVKCIHPKDEDSAFEYTPKQRERAIEKYARFMTDCPEEQDSIIDEYDHNRGTRGKAWKLMSQGFAQKDKDLMNRAYRMMRGARYRHQRTNYDSLLRQGYDRETARMLIR